MTLLILIPTEFVVPVIEILSNVTPVTVFKWIAPLQLELSTAGVAHRLADVLEFVKFIFLSVTLVQEINSAPLLVMFWMVPPDPAVVPVPVTWKLPVALFIDIPLVAPLAEILLKIQSNRPPAAIFTAMAVPPDIVTSLTFNAPTLVPAIVALDPERVIPYTSLFSLRFKTENVGFVPPVEGNILL